AMAVAFGRHRRFEYRVVGGDGRFASVWIGPIRSHPVLAARGVHGSKRPSIVAGGFVIHAGESGGGARPRDIRSVLLERPHCEACLIGCRNVVLAAVATRHRRIGSLAACPDSLASPNRTQVGLRPIDRQQDCLSYASNSASFAAWREKRFWAA